MAQNHELVTIGQADVRSISESEAAALSKVVMSNDLSALSTEETITYYLAMCRMAGLNPINRPFEVLDLDGKKVLYVTKRGGDELRFVHKLSTSIVGREIMMDGKVLRVTARVSFPDGRSDEADGVVPLVEEEKLWKTNEKGKRYPEKTGKVIPLSPSDYANAVMKAETKAKRRAALSAVGLGMTDESELDTIKGARRATVNLETGEIVGGRPSPTIDVMAPAPPAADPHEERGHGGTGKMPSPPPPYRQNQEQAPPHRPAAGNTDIDRKQLLLDRAHARTSHEALHHWATDLGYASLKDVTIPELAELLNWIRSDQGLGEFLDKHEVIEAEYADVGDDLTNDPDLQAKADAVQGGGR